VKFRIIAASVGAVALAGIAALTSVEARRGRLVIEGPNWSGGYLLNDETDDVEWVRSRWPWMIDWSIWGGGHGGDEYGNCSLYYRTPLLGVVWFYPTGHYQTMVEVPEPGENRWADEREYNGYHGPDREVGSFRYDADVDALYYKLRNEEVKLTVPFGDSVNIDVNEDGQAVGIEVLNPPGFGAIMQDRGADFVMLRDRMHRYRKIIEGGTKLRWMIVSYARAQSTLKRDNWHAFLEFTGLTESELERWAEDGTVPSRWERVELHRAARMA
jgi:uncharacterized protein YuzE